MTVVVASRDRRRTLMETVPRHLALPERPAVVVVDDGSSDGTAEALAAACPQVKLIRLQVPAGGAARNVGAAESDSPYLAITDDDAWWRPGALAAATALLDRHPALAVVQPHVLVGAEERDDPTCLAMREGLLPAPPGLPGRPIASFVACAVVLRRSAMLQVGGFHRRLGTGGEEALLSWDLAAAGWELAYVPSIVARHAPAATGARPERRASELRNALWTAWLRRPPRAALRRSAALLGNAPRDAVTLRSVSAALAGWHWVARERRRLPDHVERRLRLLE